MEDSIAQLGRFVRSATSKIKEQASEFIERSTPLEKCLREATANTNWGCATTVLAEIAKASYDYNESNMIMRHVWDGASDKPSRWRRIFKSLTLLEYLILNGSERVSNEGGQSISIHRIRTLMDFHYTEKGVDKGAGIRKIAKTIHSLVNDQAELREQREKARRTRDKFVGIGPRGKVSSTAYGYLSTLEKSAESRPNPKGFYTTGTKYDPWEPHAQKTSTASGREEVLKEQDMERQRAGQQRDLARQRRERQRERTRIQNQKKEETAQRGRKNKLSIDKSPCTSSAASDSVSAQSVSESSSSSDNLNVTRDTIRSRRTKSGAGAGRRRNASRESASSGDESSSDSSQSSEAETRKVKSTGKVQRQVENHASVKRTANLLDFDLTQTVSPGFTDTDDWGAFASAPPPQFQVPMATRRSVDNVSYGSLPPANSQMYSNQTPPRAAMPGIQKNQAISNPFAPSGQATVCDRMPDFFASSSSSAVSHSVASPWMYASSQPIAGLDSSRIDTSFTTSMPSYPSMQNTNPNAMNASGNTNRFIQQQCATQMGTPYPAAQHATIGTPGYFQSIPQQSFAEFSFP